MKIKNVLLTLGLALGLGVSAVAGLSATQDVKAADAASIPAETKFYLTPSAYWNQSNARFAIYFFGNGESWVSMTKVAGETNLYEATSPTETFSKLIFCRMNPGAAANNWNNKWNQTADLTYDGTNNSYAVKEGTWDKGGGTWSKYAPGEEQKEYAVEEYVVVDGEIVGEKVTKTLSTDTYTPDSFISNEIRTTIGIYTDLEKTTEYTGKLVEGVTNTLYLHYESIKNLGYVYLPKIDTNVWGSIKEFNVYCWDANGDLSYGSWPGTKFILNDIEATGTNFNGTGLYRIPFKSDTKVTGFIINIEGKQTKDLTFALNTYYDINTQIKTAAGQKYDGDASLGLQAKLAFEVSEALKTAGSHKYGETTYEHSICALDSAVITSILTGYSALTDTAKFDAATFWTNNVDGRKDGLGEVQASGDYTGLEVITTLTRLQTSATGSNLIIKMTMENNSSMLVIIIAAAVAVSALGVYLIIRRRKNEK